MYLTFTFIEAVTYTGIYGHPNIRLKISQKGVLEESTGSIQRDLGWTESVRSVSNRIIRQLRLPRLGGQFHGRHESDYRRVYY